MVFSIIGILPIPFFLMVFFLQIVNKKKAVRDNYYYTMLSRLRILKEEWIEKSNKKLRDMNLHKNKRIQKLEELIYGSGKQLVKGGIQLPPLDLTNSGIFSIKKT
jgi:hypothetical protein